MTVHVVYLTTKLVDSTGAIVDKNNSTIAQVIRNTSTELRVIPDADYPNSSDWPTIKEFLTREAADGFQAQIVNNTIIITYD